MPWRRNGVQLFGLPSGFRRSAREREINNVEPRKDASENRPQDGAIAFPGANDREGRAQADAGLCHMRDVGDLVDDLSQKHRRRVAGRGGPAMIWWEQGEIKIRRDDVYSFPSFHFRPIATSPFLSE